MGREEMTPETVIAVARRLQKRKRKPVTARDIWFELSGVTMYDKYVRGDARRISNILRQTKAKNQVLRVEVKHGIAEYTVREE